MFQEPYQMERMVHIFLHDLRSPLSVAQGYLHLLDGRQLPEDARPRALRGVSDALNRMATLVADASSLLEPEGAAHHGTVATAQLCDRVRAEAEHIGVAVVLPQPCPDGHVRVGSSLDSLAGAIAVLLHLVESEAQRAALGRLTLTMTVADAAVRFDVSRASAGTTPARDLIPCDPWETGKLDYLVAYRRLFSVQGGVWCKVGETRACGVSLPMEVASP